MPFYSKSKAELVRIGSDAFAMLEFSSGHKSNHKYSTSTVSDPPNQNTMFHYQHHRQQPYVVRQQVYTTQVQAAMVETVVDCYEAAKRYGGTVIVDYAKRKPTRRGFFD
ncbi:hypothetical protein HanIR_Chr05g0217841 [Helianthus annuus]|nr:hypothetical protein HanIR_Chr05g0217841 [Helianthus annuus]